MADIAGRSPSSGETTTQQIKDHTKAVGESAVHAGGDVAQSVKEQSRQVANEAGRQARQLYGQVRSEVTGQARVQQKRAADGLYAIADEATRLADRGGESGVVTQVVREASARIKDVGHWLEDREPGHVLDEVKSYARKHPGTFLVGAALLGVLAGRFTKNAIGETQDPTTPATAPTPAPLSTSDLQDPYAPAYPAQQAYPTGQVRS